MSKVIKVLNDRDRIALGEMYLSDRIQSGLTYKQLAERHDTSVATVRKRMDLAIQTRLAQTVDGMRAEQSEMLNGLLSKQYDQLNMAEKMMEDGENLGISKFITEGLKARQAALNSIRETLESIRKLYGLDAPTTTKTQVTVTATDETDALAAILAENERRARQLESGVIEGEVVE